MKYKIPNDCRDLRAPDGSCRHPSFQTIDCKKTVKYYHAGIFQNYGRGAGTKQVPDPLLVSTIAEIMEEKVKVGRHEKSGNSELVFTTDRIEVSVQFPLSQIFNEQFEWFELRMHELCWLACGQENNVSGVFNDIKIHIGPTKQLFHDDVKMILRRLLRKYIQYSLRNIVAKSENSTRRLMRSARVFSGVNDMGSESLTCQ